MYLGPQLSRRVVSLRHVGEFEPIHYENRGLFFVQGEWKCLEDGNALIVQVLVDESDGCIVDARFRGFASALCVALLDILLTSILRKNFVQVVQLSVKVFLPYLVRQSKEEILPLVEGWHQLFLSMFKEMKEKCQHIKIVVPAKETPTVLSAFADDTAEHPDFLFLSDEKKAAVVEETLKKEVLPYIALDGGGLEVLGVEHTIVRVRYLGECVSCVSSLGTTLQAVENILQRRVHPSLQVQPDLQALHPSLLQGGSNGEKEVSFD